MKAYLKQMTEIARPRTVKRKVASLRAFFNFLEFEDRITVSPFRKLRIKIAQEERLPAVLTLAEVRMLFEYLYKKKQELGVKVTPTQELLIRDIAVIEMLFATGMRVSELCKLNLGDVDLESGSVLIFGKGRRERLVPLCEPKVLTSLRTYLQSRGDKQNRADGFFRNRSQVRLSEQSVRFLVEKHTLAAKVTKKVTPHTFRHTIATLLLENGMDIRNIQHMLGHSSITTTQIYVKVNTRAQRELLGRMHPRTLI